MKKKIRLSKIQQNVRDGCILYIIVVNPDGVQCTCTQSQTSPLVASTPSSALPVSLWEWWACDDPASWWPLDAVIPSLAEAFARHNGIPVYSIHRQSIPITFSSHTQICTQIFSHAPERLLLLIYSIDFKQDETSNNNSWKQNLLKMHLIKFSTVRVLAVYHWSSLWDKVCTT